MHDLHLHHHYLCDPGHCPALTHPNFPRVISTNGLLSHAINKAHIDALFLLLVLCHKGIIERGALDSDKESRRAAQHNVPLIGQYLRQLDTESGIV